MSATGSQLKDMPRIGDEPSQELIAPVWGLVGVLLRRAHQRPEVGEVAVESMPPLAAEAVGHSEPAEAARCLASAL